MNLIINHSSMQPIYEQIVGQIKGQILHGELQEGTMLPSLKFDTKTNGKPVKSRLPAFCLHVVYSSDLDMKKIF